MYNDVSDIIWVIPFRKILKHTLPKLHALRVDSLILKYGLQNSTALSLADKHTTYAYVDTCHLQPRLTQCAYVHHRKRYALNLAA